LLERVSSEKLVGLVMGLRGVSLAACVGLVSASVFSFALLPRAAPAATSRANVATAPPLPAPAPTQDGPAPTQPSRFEQLPALHIENQTTRESRDLRLYDASGHVDAAAAAELDQLLCDARRPKQRDTTQLSRRTLQLLFKAAYHFGKHEVEVVSAYRKPGRRREGPHGTGSAIDFRLRGVTAAELASYLRQIPRTGVGIYTHPKTQFVHLDTREHSFHWIDASPPRRRWRERSIGVPHLEKHDALYNPADDWP
jgi:uncharacterized protein YcbK (DUF882 family)